MDLSPFYVTVYTASLESFVMRSNLVCRAWSSDWTVRDPSDGQKDGTLDCLPACRKWLELVATVGHQNFVQLPLTAIVSMI